MTWDEALSKLHQAPHAEFVAERKRLAIGELKPLGKVGRPSISAWAVNQLWWQARAELEAMLGTAKNVKGGMLEAMTEHKAALRKLHDRAKEILEKEGNAASLSTLAKIDTTLAALAAAGGFAPDLPGTLSEDRDPPGFAALGIVPVTAEPKEDLEALKKEQEAKATAAALEKAQADVASHEARVAKLAAELEAARSVLAAAKKRVSELG